MERLGDVELYLGQKISELIGGRQGGFGGQNGGEASEVGLGGRW